MSWSEVDRRRFVRGTLRALRVELPEEPADVRVPASTRPLAEVETEIAALRRQLSPRGRIEYLRQENARLRAQVAAGEARISQLRAIEARLR